MSDKTDVPQEEDCSLKEFPKKFEMVCNFLTLHGRISVEAGGKEIGSFHKELISARDCYHLNNKGGHTIAKATKSILSIGSEYTIKSKLTEDKFVIKKQNLSSMVSIGEIYEITKNGTAVAKCQKSDLIHKKADVSDCDGKVLYAHMKKAHFTIHTTWKIKIDELCPVEPWVIGFFAAIMISDYEESSSDEEK